MYALSSKPGEKRLNNVKSKTRLVKAKVNGVKRWVLLKPCFMFLRIVLLLLNLRLMINFRYMDRSNRITAIEMPTFVLKMIMLMAIKAIVRRYHKSDRRVNLLKNSLLYFCFRILLHISPLKIEMVSSRMVRAMIRPIIELVKADFNLSAFCDKAIITCWFAMVWFTLLSFRTEKVSNMKLKLFLRNRPSRRIMTEAVMARQKPSIEL